MELICLREHDPCWETEFDEERRQLLEALRFLHVVIHHVGSTAVSDLKSKPIIDIAIEAAVYPPSQDVIDCLAVVGYQYRGESGLPGRSWFTKGDPRKYNLHFCERESPIVKNQLIFRDALRKSERLRREYEILKEENAFQRGIDDTDYALSKSTLIQRVVSTSYENDRF